jgi:hypothetical protein
MSSDAPISLVVHTEPAKKSRSKPKKAAVDAAPEAIVSATMDENAVSPTPVPVPVVVDDADNSKKKGRKPRGGKLILKQTESSSALQTIPNIILHLKCSNRDLHEYNAKMSKLVKNPLEYNPDVPPQISTYNEHAQQFSEFDQKPPDSNLSLAYQEPVVQVSSQQSFVCPDCNVTMLPYANESTENEDHPNENMNMKEINAKLKQLKIQLYKNSLAGDKKSACFWCTYDFDNAPCYIPKYDTDNTVYGYGSFCRPECAVAYLMKENIDDSTKFDRYHLLNQIYSKVYNSKKNIKPAPNPYYLLEKFYGNLSIQEYRKLLKTEHLFMVIDKPLTRILPELHEDNEDLIMNIYGMNKPATTNATASGVYKVKRQSEKQQGPSKSSIIRNKFGLQ